MYFKINPTGCGEKNGCVEVRFDCYLESSDADYAKHHVTVPDMSAGKYEGKVDESGFPVDVDDYKKWVATLPTITKDNPFCCHFRCFSPEVTDEELVASGESILAMAHTNFRNGELRNNSNPKADFTSNITKIQASLSRVEAIKVTDFSMEMAK